MSSCLVESPLVPGRSPFRCSTPGSEFCQGRPGPAEPASPHPSRSCSAGAGLSPDHPEGTFHRSAVGSGSGCGSEPSRELSQRPRRPSRTSGLSFPSILPGSPPSCRVSTSAATSSLWKRVRGSQRAPPVQEAPGGVSGSDASDDLFRCQ